MKQLYAENKNYFQIQVRMQNIYIYIKNRIMILKITENIEGEDVREGI